MKHSLAWFVLPYIVVLLIPIVLGSVLFVTAVRIAEENSQNDNTALLRLVREMVDVRLRETVQLSRQIAANPSLNDFLRVHRPLDTDARLLATRTIGELGRFKDISSAVDDFYLYFPDADIVLTPTAYYDSRLFFHAVQKHRPVSYEEWTASITAPQRQRRFVPSGTGSAGLPFRGTISYMQPLPIDYYRESIGVLVLSIDTGTIIGTLEQSGRRDGTVISVIDESDRVVFSTDSAAGLPIGYVEMPDDTGMSVKNGRDGRVVVFYTTSRESSWKYAAAVPESVFLERARFIRNTTAWVFIACLAIGLLAVVLLAYRSYRPYRAAVDENREMRGLFLEHRQVMVNTLLLQLLRGPKGKVEFILRSLERYGLVIPPSAIHVAALRTLSRDAAVGMLAAGGTGPDLLGVPVVEWNEKILVVLIAAGEAEKAAEVLLRRLVCALRERGDEEAVAGLGSACRSADELCLSFREAMNALTAADVGDQAVAVACGGEVTDFSYEYPLSTESRYMNAMRAGDLRAAEAVVERVFEENLRHRHLTEGLLRCLMFDLVSGIVKVRDDLGLFRQAGDHVDPVIELVSAGTFREFRMGLNQAIRETCGIAGARKKSHNEKLKEELLAYVGEHFNDSLLSVSAIADHFRLNPAYLSHFFKEQTGCNLLDYINRLRMTRVKELLTDRSLTLSKVAGLTGFSNDIVLNRVFKKYNGLTPGQYRDGLA